MTPIKARCILPSNGKAHGWRPDIPDPANDYKLSKKLGDCPTVAPESPSLNPRYFPRIRDQGDLGSCTGFGARNCLAYKIRERMGDRLEGSWGKKWDLSPLAAYYFAREEDNCIDVDVGAYIRHAIIGARKYGLPTEAAWPYEEAKFRRRPPPKALQEGLWHQADAVKSYRCDEDRDNEKTVTRILQALEAGLPVEFGFTCYDNLAEADDNGMIPLPTSRSRVEGGHATTIYWADTPSRHFFGPNSWGKWGRRAGLPDMVHDERGYFGIPFEYFLQGMADDAWAVEFETVE